MLFETNKTRKNIFGSWFNFRTRNESFVCTAIENCTYFTLEPNNLPIMVIYLTKPGNVAKRVKCRFSDSLIAKFGFNQHPALNVASLDKTVYDDYLCLVAANKLQIHWRRTRRSLLGKLLDRC